MRWREKSYTIHRTSETLGNDDAWTYRKRSVGYDAKIKHFVGGTQVSRRSRTVSDPSEGRETGLLRTSSKRMQKSTSSRDTSCCIRRCKLCIMIMEKFMRQPENEAAETVKDSKATAKLANTAANAATDALSPATTASNAVSKSVEHATAAWRRPMPQSPRQSQRETLATSRAESLEHSLSKSNRRTDRAPTNSSNLFDSYLFDTYSTNRTRPFNCSICSIFLEGCLEYSTNIRCF
jgi:hypothetical protein